ncbi:MAG: hypothetical protein NT045_04100 [Candidatus Aureabacteria bacterium]|nr:hypothetical protein [Candidatus Auribacterota bacterium]
MQAVTAEGWGYVSGWCASLEAQLLGRDFFLELLRETTAEGAYGKIAKDWLHDLPLECADHRLFAAHPARALSLMVDGAYLNAMTHLATAQQELRPYLSVLVSLKTLSVVWRSLRSGLDLSWLGAFFFWGAVPAPDLKTIESDRSVVKMIHEMGLHEFPLTEEEFGESLGREADDYLTSVAMRGSHEVFGAGRVLSYLRRLWAEHFNMRLCLSAIMTPLDRRDVQMRIRNG